MQGEFRLRPGGEHYCCIVDVLGRLGLLAEAEALVDEMPFLPNAVAWATLLGACKTHKDVPRAVRAAENASKLESFNLLPHIF